MLFLLLSLLCLACAGSFPNGLGLGYAQTKVAETFDNAGWSQVASAQSLFDAAVGGWFSPEQSLWVVVGDHAGSGVIGVAPDAPSISFATVLHPIPQRVYDVTFAPSLNRWVAVGGYMTGVASTGPLAAYSSDAMTWSAVTTDLRTIFSGQFDSGTAVVFGNGMFVMGAKSGVASFAYSSDGLVWTASGSNSFGVSTNHIRFGSLPSLGYVFAAAGQGSGHNYAFSNNSGATWTPLNDPVGCGTTGEFSVSYGQGKFVFCCSGQGKCGVTTNFTTFVTNSSPKSARAVEFCPNQNVFFAGGTDSVTLLTSADGVTWTPSTFSSFMTGLVARSGASPTTSATMMTTTALAATTTTLSTAFTSASTTAFATLATTTTATTRTTTTTKATTTTTATSQTATAALTSPPVTTPSSCCYWCGIASCWCPNPKYPAFQGGCYLPNGFCMCRYNPSQVKGFCFNLFFFFCFFVSCLFRLF
jgi:hypothetical protein